MSGRVHTPRASVIALLAFLCAAVSASVASHPAFAEDGTESGNTVESTQKRSAAGREDLDIFVLEDEDGNLQKIINVPLEEIQQLRDRRLREGEEPEFALDQFYAEGKVTEAGAELDIRIDISLPANDSKQPVRIPLHLGGLIIQEVPRYVGQGVGHVVRNDNEELELWLRGDGTDQHAVTLRGLALIDSEGDYQTLRMLVPRTTMSELKLEFSEKVVRPEASDGVSVEILDTGNAETSRFRFRGIEGEAILTWRNQDVSLVEEPAALDVEGMQLVEIQDWSVRVQADLKVTSRGKPFDKFRVSLPEGFGLVDEHHHRYRVKPVPLARPDSSQRLVDIELDRMATGPVLIQLAAERSYEVEPAGTRLSLSGFDVEGAIRQGGHIALRVDEGRRARATTREDIRRVDDLPAELAGESVVAGFEYFRQPYQLEVTIAPPVASVSVEPQYTLDVSANEVTLTGKLDYRVSGSNVHELVVDLAGWQVDLNAGVTAERVRIDEVSQDAAGELKIPLTAGMKGDFELEFAAQKAISPDTSLLRFSLPRPRNELRGVTTVIVLSEDNVQLAPRRDELLGLAPLRIPPEVELPGRQQKPFYYGTEAEDAEFVCDFRIRDRAVAVAVDSLVDLSERTVEQIFQYDVEFEPIDSLSLNIPRQLFSEGKYRVLLDGDPLEMVELREASPEDTTILIGASLSEPIIGEFRLSTRTPLPQGAVVSVEDSVEKRLDVPLMMPAEGTLTRNELRFVSGGELDWDLLDEEWTDVAIQASPTIEKIDRRVRAKEPISLVQLSIRALEKPATTPVLVKRAWVRTWLTAEGRRDFATYRLRSRDSTLNVELPAGTDDNIRVHVDGEEVAASPPKISDAGVPIIQIPLPADMNRDFSLDLRYSLPYGDGRSFDTIETPRFSTGADIEDMVYQELLVPAGKHLLATPQGLTAAWRWRWDTFRWVREPLMSATELAEWSSSSMGSHQDVDRWVEGGQWARYLFSSMSAGEPYQAEFIRRGTATLIGAGTILAMGLALLYVPLLRRPGVMLVWAIGLLAVGVIYPQPTLILAQAGALGLILVLFAMVLKHLLKSRSVSIVEVTSPVGSSARLRTTEFHYATPGQTASSQRTTLTPAPMSSFTQQEPASSKS